MDSSSDSIALVAGAPFVKMPQDLYIPPDALKVFLESFEGPLDLLLYLIRKQNLDILSVHVSEITDQYITYVDMMHEMKFELAAEYLVMAATLAEIKSRMLLPRVHDDDEEEVDPRAALIRRLQEYERFKNAGEAIDELPREERDFHLVQSQMYNAVTEKPFPDVALNEIALAFAEVLKKADLFESHQVESESLSTRERMTMILESAQSSGRMLRFRELFTIEEGRQGVVVAFLAIMELVKEGLLDIVQSTPFAEVMVKAKPMEVYDVSRL